MLYSEILVRLNAFIGKGIRQNRLRIAVLLPESHFENFPIHIDMRCCIWHIITFKIIYTMSVFPHFDRGTVKKTQFRKLRR